MSIESINNTGSTFFGLTTPIKNMTSGQQINSAADNPAGLAVANSLQQQALRDSVGLRSASDGISLLQTAESNSRSMTTNIQRMMEISIQSMNGTMNSTQRNALNSEFQQMIQAIDQTSQTTKFNGMTLLNGENTELKLALGGSESSITLPELSLASLGLSGLNLNNTNNASLALDILQSASRLLDDTQALFGAQQNGLISAGNQLMSQQQNTLASFSQIMDTNYAKSASDKARDDVLFKASMMMQAQGNQDRANVLQLIN